MSGAEERERAVLAETTPPSLAELVAGRSWARNLVGETEAVVHRLHAPGEPDLFLKSGRGDAADEVADEFARMRWLRPRLPSPKPLGFVAQEAEAWLLMTGVPGCTAYQMLEAQPAAREGTVTALATFLNRLHALPAAECPFNAGHALRLAHARRRLEAGLIDEGDFDDARAGWSAEDVVRELEATSGFTPDPVVTHGDFSLDNILMQDGEVTGCIDLARLGVADRHQDLAILCNCLDEFAPDLRHLFLRAYGASHVDERKMRFHLLLDECF